MMAHLQQFNVYVVVILLYMERTLTIACPQSCTCRGTFANCEPGLSAFPTGLDPATVKSLAVSGSASKHNTLGTIHRADVQALKDLFTLVIAYAEIQTIDSDAFADLANLHDLSLRDNNIVSLDPNVFRGLAKLRTLDLSGNVGLQIDKSVFTHITQIEELNLGALGAEEFPTDVFSTLTSLKVLKLYSNNMQAFDADLIKPLSNLQALDLTANELLGLPSALQPQFSQLQALHLSENPWQCNCQLVWLRNLKSAFISSSVDSNDVICNGPAKLKYASIMNVPEKDFLCIPPKVVRCDSDSYTVDENKNVAISCEFDGDPIPDVKWSHGSGFEIDGRETSAGRYQIYKNGTLVITSVKITDDGAWIVTAYNETAFDKHTVNVHVPVTTTSTTTTTTTTTTTPTPPTTTTITTRTTQATTTPITTSTKPNTVTTQAAAVTSSSSKLQTNPVFVKTTALRQSSISNSITGLASPQPSVASTGDKGEIKTKSGMNYGLLAAAFAAGGTLVGTCFIFVMCCKRKQSSEKNKIAAFDDDL